MDDNMDLEIDDDDQDIDVNDYEIEEGGYDDFINLLNIYTCYFKQLFDKTQHENIFNGIDYEKSDSTNRCMEFLYEEIFKYNSSDDPNKDVLYGPDDNEIKLEECKELYTLCIDDVPSLICKFLLPILKYLSNSDWLNINWYIVPIKN